MEKTGFQRWVFLILLLVLFAALSGTAACADSVPVLTVGSAYDATPDGLVEIPVTVSDVNDLAMVQFALGYDAETLEYVGFRTGALLPEQETPTVNGEVAGKVYFVWDSTESLTGSGELAVFSFLVKDTALGETEIGIDEDEEVVFADSTFQRITPGFVSGRIVIFDFCLPVSLTAIGEEAFAGTALSCVRLSENTTAIGPRAFAGCTGLTYIIIPADAAIDSTAFAGLSGLTVIGLSGSSAERLAQDTGFSFVAIGA